MNATNLHLPDGTPTQVWFCTTCRIVHRTQQSAESCCTPVLCETCQQPVAEKHWTKCRTCRDTAIAAKEADRFEKAAKIPDTEYDGWVYLKGDFFDCVESLVEHLESQHDGEDPCSLPLYCWACTSEKVIDGSSLMHRLLDGIEAWDEFDPTKDLDGIPALQIALEAFAEINKEVVTYNPDFTRAITISQSLA